MKGSLKRCTSVARFSIALLAAVSGLTGHSQSTQAQTTTTSPSPSVANIMATLNMTPISDWSCEVLFCLANPNGPKAVSECVPPSTRLYRAMASFRFTFPSCAMASGPNGRSWATLSFNYYDPCPSGITALGTGALAVDPVAGTVLAGIGDGAGLAPTIDSALPTKTCVGRVNGSQLTMVGDLAEGGGWYQVATFDRIVQVSPSGNPTIINVFIDSVLNKVVRPF